jgi:oxygen-independent coproporphyrinogen III oxidase
MEAIATPHLTHELLARMDMPGPRYTSYPTADRFHGHFGQADLLRALAGCGLRAKTQPDYALSLYVHIPFCQQLCYYCACNKIITRHHEQALPYLDALEAELALNIAALGVDRVSASQVHLGGGSPTFLSDAELTRLMDTLRTHFPFTADAEISIEIDPRTTDGARLAHLRNLGFNRISFGVQDFDEHVQKAVHRIQPVEDVAALMQHARTLAFDSINVDLIYGLPLQTPQTMAQTVARVAKLKPDRIALYGYAHLPERFKPQRRIDAHELPSGAQRLEMLSTAIAGFAAHGYVYIGMDHFALPGDALAQAKRAGTLHRNFQGYSTQPDRDLIALGVSAIGRVGNTYSQNAKTLPEYYAAVHQGQLPVVRGIELTQDDALRRAVIMALMCQGRVEFAQIEQEFGILFAQYFADELQRLLPFEASGQVLLTHQSIEVTAMGWFFVRAVAMVFDEYLKQGLQEKRFSRVI